MIQCAHLRVNVFVSVAEDYLVMLRGEFLGILLIYIFCRIEEVLVHPSNVVCSTQGHGFMVNLTTNEV